MNPAVPSGAQLHYFRLFFYAVSLEIFARTLCCTVLYRADCTVSYMPFTTCNVARG